MNVSFNGKFISKQLTYKVYPKFLIFSSFKICIDTLSIFFVQQVTYIHKHDQID